MKVEICSNCEGLIGKLEPAYLFNENLVCEKCNEKLTAKSMTKNVPQRYNKYDPATQTELKVARQLGISVSSDIARYQIRRLIDRANGVEEKKVYKNIPATYKQIRFAKRLGIKNAEFMRKDQLSDEIDLSLAQKDPPTRSNIIVLRDNIEDFIKNENTKKIIKTSKLLFISLKKLIAFGLLKIKDICNNPANDDNQSEEFKQS